MEKLFDKFPPISTQEWESLIVKDLKGSDYQKKLVGKTYEQISIQPYYRKEDLELAFQLTEKGVFPYKKYNNSAWKIRQNFILEGNINSLNKKIISAIQNGLNSIGLIINNIDELSVNVIGSVLKNLNLEEIEVNFVCKSKGFEVLGIVREYFFSLKTDLSKYLFNIEYDPFFLFITQGESIIEGIENIRLMILNATFAPNMRIGVIDSSIFNNCGASSTEEVAFGMSELADLLDYLTEAGLSIDDIIKRLKFKTSIGSDYFIEIAKIRAIRFLWAKICEANEPVNTNNCSIYLHAETSLWNKTLYDPYVNLLRTTTEAMSSIIGGIDSLCIYNFNVVTTYDDDFAFRIARNQQLLLKEESGFDKISDPSAGSYYIEYLTSQIINKSWEQFLMVIEKQGFIECFKTNFIQNIISGSAEKKTLAIATRKMSFIGINQFPNITETINFKCIKEEETTNLCQQDCENVNYFKTLQAFRGMENIERLRLKTEIFSEETGHRPSVFLFTYGHLAMRIARAGFASNFFGCAGFEIINNNGFSSVEVGIKAAKDSKADIVVICSADEEYENIAPEIYSQLKDCTIVVIAGNPKESMDKLTACGISNFIHVKTNLLESLEYYQNLIIK